MGNIDVYLNIASPPCRAVILLLTALNIQYNPITVDIMHGEQLKPEFIRMNPLHTIPTINDNGFILHDSHAIMEYVIEQYAKNNSFYPECPKKKAIINQQLFYNVGTLWPKFKEYLLPVVVNGQSLEESTIKHLEEALNFLDISVNDQQWVAGSDLTIADFAIIPTISTIEATGFDFSKFTNLISWYDRVKKAMVNYGYEENNQKGSDIIGNAFKSQLRKSK